MRKLHTRFLFRSNETKYDLVFLEALVYQVTRSFTSHALSAGHEGLSFEFFLTADGTVGNPTNLDCRRNSGESHQSGSHSATYTLLPALQVQTLNGFMDTNSFGCK